MDVKTKDSCRIYGDLEIHKCQGDFHITARGHGYQAFGAEHLDHESTFSFKRMCWWRNQFHTYHRWILIWRILSKDCQSLGCDITNDQRTYIRIRDPANLDLYRFQYFLSVVPTVYIANDFNQRIIDTNQYAVTEQSHPSAGALGQEIPGIFFKYDVEPLQLTILHGHLSTYRFFMRLVAVIGGVVVCTEWLYKAFDALTQRLERRNGSGRRVSSNNGLLNGVLEKEAWMIDPFALQSHGRLV